SEPRNMIVDIKDSPVLQCSHSISDYDRILWYKQTQDGQLVFLGYLLGVNDLLEPELTFKESAVIPFESLFDMTVVCCANYQAYFGNGTKLTVLERDVKEPEVEILKPSGIETRCKKTITLVCVAEKFYPDHVSITWTLGDKEIKENVATDPYATQDKTTKLFSMTSRLKVSKKEFKPKNKYRCTVNFYNGTHDISDNTDEINGIEGISLDIN
uniref:Ig-like domain-containing protein n=1 Tax=Cyprinus carpio carpio TaxID=630221 RepID=A0A9J8BP73_CYPCA